MSGKRAPGLDELMIVNPGAAGSKVRLRPGQFFLGEDGTLYQLQSAGESDPGQGLAGYFLGDDGDLYLVQEPGRGRAQVGANEYYLGEDGTLYQIVEP